MSELELEVEYDDTTELELEDEETSDIDIENSDVVGTGETTNYEKLKNKPQINSVELLGDKSSDELGLQDEMEALTNTEIESLINNYV